MLKIKTSSGIRKQIDFIMLKLSLNLQELQRSIDSKIMLIVIISRTKTCDVQYLFPIQQIKHVIGRTFDRIGQQNQTDDNIKS